MERQNNFDLLRLVAALSVILSHAFLLSENSQDHDPLTILTGGQTILGVVGVFVFFTISGYLVTQSFDTTGSPLVFLVKRALRIFPGLLLCLAICAFVIGPLVSGLSLAAYFAHPGPYLYVLHNAVLDTEYNRLPDVVFGPGNIGGIVNGPLWSLPCEVLMYLMLFALGVCRRLTLRTGLLLLAIGIGCLWSEVTAAQCVVYFSGGAAPWWEVFLISLALSVPAALLSWHAVERRCRWRARAGARMGAEPAAAVAN